jgi:hypothetical protein
LQVVAPDAAGADVAASGADAAGGFLAAFWTPPCPLHAPRPVAADVVPSLQTVEAGSAARAGNANVNANNGIARKRPTSLFFMEFHSRK